MKLLNIKKKSPITKDGETNKPIFLVDGWFCDVPLKNGYSTVKKVDCLQDLLDYFQDDRKVIEFIQSHTFQIIDR